MTGLASLELHRVSAHHGGAMVLGECDLLIEEGTHTTILGRSGAGKSTALRLLAGLELPTCGQVLVDGMLASEAGRRILPPHQRRIAMVFQDLGLWPALSVIDNVLLGLAVTDRGREQRRAQAVAALRLCRINSLADRRPASLSGGEQQRLALARAVAAEPRFLFLDEPFAGLDLCTKRELLTDISQLAAERRSTLVLVTHDPTEALSLCHRAVLLEAGRVRADGSWAEVLREPQSELLRAFRDCLPQAVAPSG